MFERNIFFFTYISILSMCHAVLQIYQRLDTFLALFLRIYTNYIFLVKMSLRKGLKENRMATFIDKMAKRTGYGW